MKIAVPLRLNGDIDDHFGHCSSYGIFTISGDNMIAEKTIIQAEQGCGCKSDIASKLAQLGVSVMLAGGIGEGAVNVLAREGIKVVRGCYGDAEKNVYDYLEGKITDSRKNCIHHEHGHQHGHAHHNKYDH